MKKYLPEVLLPALLLFFSFQSAAAELYSAGATTLEFDNVKGAFRLSVPGAPSDFTCDRLWDIRFFDEEARKANLRSSDEFNIGCNERYVQSRAFLDRTRAKLQTTRFDRRTGEFSAEYRHPSADVKFLVTLRPDRAEYQLELTNRSEVPICAIVPAPGLEFRLGDRKLIVPDGEFSGIEAQGCVNCYYWGSNSAWNGLLLSAADGNVFAIDIVPAPSRRSDPSISHIDGDPESGKNLRLSSEYVCWVKPGETRRTPSVHLQTFPDLRSWADCSIQRLFPEGMKTLDRKYSTELWERLRHAYWAAGSGKLAELSPVVANAPGRALLQLGNFMRPVKGSAEKIQLDSFPNYFPVNPYFGTEEEHEQLIRRVAANGGIYVPRTSFFYWVKGSDFDLENDLRKSAIVRVGGNTPCTAKWGNVPGYIVSPSDPVAAEHMENTAEKFKSLGAEGYFTNVICAVNPFSIRYDFHRAAPAPDLLYSQIDRLFRRHGEGKPLFAEGNGGFWLTPHLAGICSDMRDNRFSPISWNSRFLASPRQAWAPGLMLTHEYIVNLPHNLKPNDATTTVPRLTHSLLNGFMLKGAFMPEKEFTRNSILWLRTCAVFSQEVTSRLIGRRLLSYVENGDIVTADYSGSVVTANLSDRGIPWEAGENRGVIAPDGFGFRNDAEGVAAGYFSELNAVKYKNPLLLLVAGNRLYAPLETAPSQVVWNGAAVEIPAYAPCLERSVRGVTLAADGKAIADPDGSGFSPAVPRIGLDAPPPPSAAVDVPLLIDWDCTQELSAGLKLTAPASVTSEGIRLVGKNGSARFDAPAPFTRRFYAEMVIRYDRMPGNPDKSGCSPLVTALMPEGSYYWANRTVEFGYNLHAGEFRGCVASAEAGKFFWTSLPGFAIEPGRYYHAKLFVDNGKQTLTVNGVKTEKLIGNVLHQTFTGWKFGGDFDYVTISRIRFGGE